MESIRSDHEIELTFWPVFESDTDGLLVLLNPGHAVTKNRLDFAIDLAEDRCGKFRARKGLYSGLPSPGKMHRQGNRPPVLRSDSRP